MKQKSISALLSTLCQSTIPGVSVAIVLSFAGMVSSAHAQTWIGTTNGNYATNTNWSTNAVPIYGATATFNNAGMGNTTIAINAGASAVFLIDTVDAAAYTFNAAGPITWASGSSVTVNPTVITDQVFNGGFVLGTRSTPVTNSFNAGGTGGSKLTINGNYAGGLSVAGLTTTLSLNGGNGTTTQGYGVFNGVISDGIEGGNVALARVSLSSAGSSTWELNAANTYTGGTDYGRSNQNNGPFILGNKAAFGTGEIRLIGGSVPPTISASIDLSGSNAIANPITFNSPTGTNIGARTATYTVDSNVAVVSDTTGIVPGMSIVSSNYLPLQTVILTVNTGTNELTLSNPAKVAGTSVAATIAPYGTGGGTLGIAGSQNIEFTGPVYITPALKTNGAAATVNFKVTNTANTTFSGVLQEQSGAGSFEKSGAGTLVISDANTYTGGTIISEGILKVTSLAAGGAASSIGASSNGSNNLTFNGGTLLYTGSGSNTDRRFELHASSTIDSSGTGALKFNAGVGFNNGAFGPATPRTLTLSGSNTDDNTILPNMVDSGTAPNITSISKTGAGRWILGGAANTYTGTTAVTNGTLLINGTIASQGVTVASGGKIGGTGTINKSVNVDPGGGLAFVLNTNIAGHNSLDIGETLALSGTTNLTILDGSNAEVGQYLLVTAAGGITGTKPTLNMPLPGGITATLDILPGNTQLVLNVSAVSANDYTTWIESFTSPAIVGDDQLSTADPDQDGLTNQQEYAFGLIPNSGSSVNPITSQLNKTSGQFSYSRRNVTPSTGLVYTYEYSTTLSGAWTSFTPSAMSSNSLDPVETVTVTVPAAIITANSKLFVRVVAK